MRRQQGQDFPIWKTTAAMRKKTSAITIGIELGDRKHAVRVLDAVR